MSRFAIGSDANSPKEPDAWMNYERLYEYRFREIDQARDRRLA